jgi:hypothetical protein
MKLPRYSLGTGDRFGQEGKALLKAVMKARNDGINLAIVWNKSEREHSIIDSSPKDVLIEAKNAVKNLNYSGKYFIDADHIGFTYVDRFIEYSNYFTLDVAEFIGRKASKKQINSFLKNCNDYIGDIKIPHINEPLQTNNEKIRLIAEKYLLAVKKAGKIYRKIEKKKGEDNFITEISMDETDRPQTSIELFFILLAIAEEKIPLQTIAPKFTGSFIKGIDYIGDIDQFTREFNSYLAIITFAMEEFSLPSNLKLSIHSGSDKFSLYKPINKAIKKFNTGIHVKTAGTTWLEELIGLALAGDEALKMVKNIYKEAYARFEELCKPYASVISITKEALPAPESVNNWTSEQYVAALRHNPNNKSFNRNLRQLLHVAYKIAAEMGNKFIRTLKAHQKIISKQVTFNMFERHIKKLFY